MQLDGIDFALWQGRLADVGADIEHGGLGVAKQRDIGRIDRQLRLAFFERQPEVDRAGLSREAGLQAVFAQRRIGAGGGKDQSAGRKIAALNAQRRAAFDGGGQIDIGGAFEQRTEDRRHHHAEIAAAFQGEAAQTVGRQPVTAVEFQDFLAVEGCRTGSRPVGQRAGAGQRDRDGRFVRQAQQLGQHAALRFIDRRFEFQRVGCGVEDDIEGGLRFRAVALRQGKGGTDALIGGVQLAGERQKLISAGDFLADDDLGEIKRIDLHIDRKCKGRAHLPGFGGGNGQALDTDGAGGDLGCIETRGEKRGRRPVDLQLAQFGINALAVEQRHGRCRKISGQQRARVVDADDLVRGRGVFFDQHCRKPRAGRSEADEKKQQRTGHEDEAEAIEHATQRNFQEADQMIHVLSIAQVVSR